MNRQRQERIASIAREWAKQLRVNNAQEKEYARKLASDETVLQALERAFATPFRKSFLNNAPRFLIELYESPVSIGAEVRAVGILLHDALLGALGRHLQWQASEIRGVQMAIRDQARQLREIARRSASSQDAATVAHFDRLAAKREKQAAAYAGEGDPKTVAYKVNFDSAKGAASALLLRTIEIWGEPKYALVRDLVRAATGVNLSRGALRYIDKRPRAAARRAR